MALTIKQSVAQQIVEAVKDVSSHDINFIDSKGIIFASTNKKRIGDFHEIGLQVIKTGETIEVDTNDGYFGTQKGVNIPFIYKGDVSAVIGISGEPSEVRKYAYLAQKMPTLLLREHELETLEHTQKTQLNHIMRALGDHEYVNPEYLKAFIKKYGATLDSSYQTIIVKLDTRYNPSNLAMIQQYIYQAFEQTGSKLYTFNYSNEYILFLESKKLKQKLSVFEQLSQKHAPLLKVGIGHAISLGQQHLSYQSAKLAINCLLSNEYMTVFDNLDISILLGNIAPDTRNYYLSKTVSKLSEKELDLLESYFFHDMSLKDTCEELYLHKNSLQYKLDKIHKTTGYNPRNFKNAAVLYIALKLLKLKQ